MQCECVVVGDEMKGGGETLPTQPGLPTLTHFFDPVPSLYLLCVCIIIIIIIIDNNTTEWNIPKMRSTQITLIRTNVGMHSSVSPSFLFQHGLVSGRYDRISDIMLLEYCFG